MDVNNDYKSDQCKRKGGIIKTKNETGEGDKHLSLQGVGPVYAGLIIAITIGAVVLMRKGTFEFGHIRNFQMKLVMDFFGFFIIFIGYIIYVEAVFFSKIIEKVKENRLVTDGVYRYVRNPVYSAFFLVCSGVILLCHNIYLIWLPVFYWALLTILVASTEEKWLLQLYGDEYREYCNKVNRCIPWFGKE